MKIFILTQKVDVDDPVLGFFTRWIDEFSKKCEKVTVAALECGRYEAPLNVKVFSLGKERGVSRLGYVYNFYKLILKYRSEYDAVFVHMNPEYVVLGGVLWRFLGKKVGLWYTHRSVTLKLRIATLLSHFIFTASKESFQIRSRKTRIVGHGINVSDFKISHIAPEEVQTILHVGRITKIKNCDTLIEAVSLVCNGAPQHLQLKFIGQPINKEDELYKKHLEDLVRLRRLEAVVSFYGGIPSRDLPDHYANASLTVNLTPPGGIDKVVLESMASGVPAIVSNTAFESYFGSYASDLIFRERDAEDLAKKIRGILRMKDEDRKELSSYLRKYVEEHADISKLIQTVVGMLSVRQS